MAWIAAFGLYVTRAAQGLGFVPGALAGGPAAAAARPRGDRGLVVALTAIIAMPMVWLLQWQGQLLPQWGGRYLLLSGVLLLIVASLDVRQVAPAIALTVAVAGFGAAWHADRTTAFGRAVVAVNDVPRDTVVISTYAHLGREAGAVYGQRRWLTAYRRDDLAPALDVARRAGAARVAIVWLEGSVAPRPAGWTPVGPVRRVPTLGSAFLERTFTP
jgi:hypothetical protein